MSEKKGTYSLQDWVEAGAQNYKLTDEVKMQLKHMLSEVVDFCLEHDIPFHAMFGASEDSERVNVSTYANVPMRHSSGLFLAALHLGANGLNSSSIEDLHHLLEADIERNSNTADRKKPDLKLVH